MLEHLECPKCSNLSLIYVLASLVMACMESSNGLVRKDCFNGVVSRLVAVDFGDGSEFTVCSDSHHGQFVQRQTESIC